MLSKLELHSRHQPWPEPNYENPITHGQIPVVLNLLFLTLTICVFSLRVYTRLIFNKWFGSDDIFIIFAVVRQTHIQH
jgi:hypothetical protein